VFLSLAVLTAFAVVNQRIRP